MKKLKFDAPTNKAVTNVSSLLIDLDAETTAYKFVEFTNTGASDVFISFNDHTAVVNKGTVVLPFGGSFTMVSPFLESGGKVNCISNSGGENICITTAR